MGVRLDYMPTLDGLRAVAVLAVVAYHAGLPVPAGYVGVDVFFVISGYLITRLLRGELQATGRIDFAGFYARRARRILPALMAVIVATLAASAVLLPASELRQATEAGAASAVFGANIYFASAATGYFDPETHTNPLLHLWSIGVEEQFYLAWPLLLLAARRHPMVVLSAIAAGSFVLAEILLQAEMQSAAFYQTPPRAWELAVGGMIALVRFRVREWVGSTGMLVTILACVVPAIRFPGVGALLAVLGAGMVVAAAHSGHRLRGLEIRPLVAIGLASYSLYLWHWPIMVLGDAIPTWMKLLASFLIAAASYRFIELPFRRRFTTPARETVAVAMAGIACVCSAALVWSSFITPPRSMSAGLMPIYSMDCDDWYHHSRVKPCVFGDDEAEQTAVIVGDSVVLQWFPAVREIFDRPGWRLVVLTKSSCPMIEAPFYYERIGRIYTECAEWRSKALDWIDDANPEVVITGSSNSYGFDQSQWTEGAVAVLSRLAKAGEVVAIIRSTPMLIPGGHDAYDGPWHWEKTAAEKFDNVISVDMNPFVCPGGHCSRGHGAGMRFRDARHISPELALALTYQFQSAISPTP